MPAAILLTLISLTTVIHRAEAQPLGPLAAEPNRDVTSEAPGTQPSVPAPEPVPITRYELRYFDLSGGAFVELAQCDVPRREARLTGYTCYVFNLGKQHGDWVAGDALELGLRYRPFDDDTWVSAGAAYSVLGSLIGIIACDTGGDDTCEKTRLPMEGYVALGIHGVLPTSSYGIVASAQARYHGSFSGDVGYEAPQGAAFSVGLGISLN